MPDPVAQLEPPTVDPEAVRRAAEDILSRPEYRPPEPSLVERVLDAIGDFLAESLATLVGGGPGSAVGTVVVAALLGLVGVVAWRVLRARGPVLGPAVDATTTRSRDVTDAAGWWAEAARARAAGETRLALRALHRAATRALVEADVVGEAVGRTPAELATEVVAAHPAAAAPSRRLTEVFEAVWYGGAEVDPGALDAAEADARALAALAAPTPVAEAVA